MKVLLSADTVGGIFTHAVDLVAALGEHDVEVVVATFGGPLPPGGHEALEAAGAAAVHESDLRLEWMPDPWEDVRRGRAWLLGLAAAEGAELVHLNGYAHAAAGFDVPVLVGAHSCVLSWWRAVHGTDAPASWDRYRQEVRAGLRQARAVVAPTAAMLAELPRCYGAVDAETTVVPNGSSVPAAPAHTVKDPIVLGAGRLWDEAKNLAALDAAAEGLGHDVLVAGALEGADGTVVHPRAARALGPLPPRVLAGVRRRAAVFAAPARYEPFGLATLEAARDGCALVLGDIPSLREVWGDTATYVDPADPDALRAALRSLLDDLGVARAAGRRAQAHAARYTCGAMGAAYSSLYRRLVPAGATA